MKAQRMIYHAVAVAALGTMCMAQGNTGYGAQGAHQQGAGQQGAGQQGTPGQQGMGQPNGTGSTMPDSMSHDAGSMKSPDHMFIMKAAQGGMAEVKSGTLAKQNGGSDAVKDFGNKMVTDHSKANDELRELAEKKKITLPSDLSSKDKKMGKMLASKKGPEFDKAYMHDMVRDHMTDVAEFRKEAENGKDPEVKAWAQKTLPILEQHLASAKEVAGQLGVDTKKSSGAMTSHQ